MSLIEAQVLNKEKLYYSFKQLRLLFQDYVVYIQQFLSQDNLLLCMKIIFCPDKIQKKLLRHFSQIIYFVK